MPNIVPLAQQYGYFSTFASSNIGSGDAIATRDGTASGKIVAKEGHDFVGKIFRSASERAENNKVRALFTETVCKMCGVTCKEALPEPVKAAMHLEDMGKGKPLTARRISAVVKEVDAFTKAVNDMEAQLGACRIPFDRKSIRMVVRECGGDRKAIDFLTKHPEVVFTRSRGGIVPQDNLNGQLRMFLDNVADLRRAANGDERIVEAGFKFLEENVSTPAIFTGLFGDMVKAAGSINLDSLKAFSSPNSTVEERHAALVQLDQSINDASDAVADQYKTRGMVYEGKPGQAKALSIQSFLSVAAFSRLDSSTCGKVAEQFGNVSTRHLLGLYYHLGSQASSGPLTIRPDFEPKQDDSEFWGHCKCVTGSEITRDGVLSRLMSGIGGNAAPMFGTAESLLNMAFCLEKTARQRNAPIASLPTMGDRFVSSSSPRASRSTRVGGDAYQGGLSNDAIYDVTRDLFMRTYDKVVTRGLPEFASVRQSIDRLLAEQPKVVNSMTAKI